MNVTLVYYARPKVDQYPVFNNGQQEEVQGKNARTKQAGITDYLINTITYFQYALQLLAICSLGTS